MAEPGTDVWHRSGAVARMLHMPVATLRVWERRYGVTQPRLSPSGQRLYSADDVRRLSLLKQLTDRGHAIGSLAGLDMSQLQQVASTHAAAQVDRPLEHRLQGLGTNASARRVVVVGETLAARIDRPAVRKHLGVGFEVLGPYATLAQAQAALEGAANLEGAAADALLVHEPRLHGDWMADLQAQTPALARLPKAVVFRFAPEAVCRELAAAGTALMGEPQNDVVLGQWLRGVLHSLPTRPDGAPQGDVPVTEVPPRRWDDAALADFASQSSTIACECPRHVAELLMQLSHFEAYSAECRHRDAADAGLHAFLHQVASNARERFEAALEQVALHEGLILAPSSPSADSSPHPASSPRPASSIQPA